MALRNNEQLEMNGAVTLLSDDIAPTAQERRHRMANTNLDRDREKLIEVLQRELDAARAREQAALAREQRVLEHASSVVRLFEQTSKRLESVEQHIQALDQALQQISQRREAETSPALPTRALLHGRSGGALRYTILDILNGHPEGMTRQDLEAAVGAGKDLSHTIGHMKRDKLLTSKTLGVYVLANVADGS